MRNWIVAAMLLTAPVMVQSQTIVDGTNPAAPTVRLAIGSEHDSFAVGQTFIAKGDQLTQLSLWYYGPTLSSAFFDHSTRISIAQGPYSTNPPFFTTLLLQSSQGRLDLVFGAPLQMVTGALYSMVILSNDCFPGPCFPNGPPVTGVFQAPRLEVTTTDAYADGSLRFFSNPPADTPGVDIRFEAQYMVTPEPSTYALMTAGLAGLGVVSRRRQRA